MADMDIGMKSILGAFIILVIGIALLVATANSATDVTEQKTVAVEQVTLVNGTAVALANNQLDAMTSVANATNASDTLTEDTDFTMDLPQGEITSISGRAGVWNVSYTWREVGNSTARTLTSLVILLFVVGLLLFAIGKLHPTWKDIIQR